ncbi:MAG: hypothetical protein BWX66_01601 [Deltaproteobacteria bacterium ADurb.Bin058]|nr:MAG: hypothetical protein BWX66_01601 [Deltaproteobacteria bacterium ADurb.Bin058]
MPFPIIPATLKPKTSPIPTAKKLKKAAHNTASLGLNTRVETMVAIELAASFMPFRKSNSNATKTVTITRVSMLGTFPLN